ncbi:GNAT family N-acetyltransferase [Roseovarius sp. SCSIO 43702]|uniref:GNAT family N-acetyltransferase n=1 Tax=Roseovarius sp. SCSIO 43702 TaxID=2823043 RepID=UPI001C73319B|nr:GNAT family N-acetyltransferase [Roseovarius sp. SCSIO 43702]QYX57627.1 GNAT family N-acetyltransferase [Roseovarius sp. SCSIO 43702]
MTDTITIRPLAPEDEAEWRRLWKAYLAFYGTTVSDEIYETTFARLLSEDHPRQNALMALLDGKAVGLVHYIYHPHNWRIEDVCYLQDLFADPEARGKGVGRKLIEAVYRAADAAGCPSVYWMTQDFNAEARRLYDRIAQLTPFIKYQRQG